MLQLSGIVALFFSGVFHAHYSYYSVAPDAQITLRRFFQFAAFLSETFVFAYLGLQVGCRPVDMAVSSIAWSGCLLLACPCAWLTTGIAAF